MIWNKKKDGAENPGAETPAAQTTKAPVLFLQKNWKWLVPVVCVVIAGGVFLLKPKSANTTAVDPSYLEASPEVRDGDRRRAAFPCRAHRVHGQWLWFAARQGSRQEDR